MLEEEVLLSILFCPAYSNKYNFLEFTHDIQRLYSTFISMLTNLLYDHCQGTRFWWAFVLFPLPEMNKVYKANKLSI